MYSIHDYGQMISDSVRLGSYANALRQAIARDSVVLDIGTGSGILAILACKLGAFRVYAFEPNDIIVLARELAAANECSDRITFLKRLSIGESLPEYADVIVSDIHGTLPLHGSSLVSIADARRRLLKTDGILIPCCETLWVTVAEAPEIYANFVGAWSQAPFGLSLGTASRVANNCWQRCSAKKQNVLLEPKRWAVLDYKVLDEPNIRGEAVWTSQVSGVGYGLLVWFDSMLAQGITISNAPGQQELIYRQAFFPWPEPVRIFPGDSLKVKLGAQLLGGDYIWQWDSSIIGPNDLKPPVHFRQSTFFSMLISPESLQSAAATHVPALNDTGQMARFIVNQIDGRNSIGSIAEKLIESFPYRFKRLEDAFTFVNQVSNHYAG